MDTIDYKNFFYDDISTEDSLLDNIGWVFDDVLDDNLQVCISKNFFYDDVTLNGISSDDREKIVQQVLNGIIVAPNISAAVQHLKSHLQKPLIGVVKPAISSRFKENATKKLNDYSKGFVPQNTATNTNWAMRNYTEWVNWRNEHEDPGEHVPVDLLLTGDHLLI